MATNLIVSTVNIVQIGVLASFRVAGVDVQLLAFDDWKIGGADYRGHALFRVLNAISPEHARAVIEQLVDSMAFGTEVDMKNQTGHVVAQWTMPKQVYLVAADYEGENVNVELLDEPLGSWEWATSRGIN